MATQDKKTVDKSMMENYFAGGSTNGMNQSGEEDFPSEKFTLKARPDSAGTSGDDFKADKNKSA